MRGGQRTVTLKAGGRIRGEQIVKVSHPLSGGTVPCGKKGSASKTWVVELETVVKDPNNPTGPPVSSSTFIANVTVTWTEPASTTAAPGLVGGSNKATIMIYLPSTPPPPPGGPPPTPLSTSSITGAKDSGTGISWTPEEPAKPGEKK